MSDKGYKRLPTAYYGNIYNRIAELGYANGYCCALHGSVATDLDIVAVPWTEESIDGYELAKLLVNMFYEGAYIQGNGGEIFGGDREYAESLPESDEGLYGLKPHGRKVYTIILGHPFRDICYYIDLSIMPKIKNNEK